jgi:hypothetical protein
MKTIRRIKIVTRTRELVIAGQNAENETAPVVCPFCRNALAGALSSARESAVSGTNENAAELSPVKDECSETEK